MKISHRLYLTVAPSILAVGLLAGLSYWGQYARTAPELVLVGGALAALTSLVLTWVNARYVARRLERIVGGPSSHGSQAPTLRGLASAIAPGKTAAPPDEIDEIESVVDRLSTAVQIAEVRSADRERLYERRAHDYARLLASLADASVKQLEEIRLPLHILLENHFGELNENQEEMLSAARLAAEAVDADMLSLRQIASLDLGERVIREDQIRPSDIVDAVRALLISAAELTGATIEFDVEPLLPAITGDRPLLQEAFVTIMRNAIDSATADARLKLTVDRSNTVIRFTLDGGGKGQKSVRGAAAVRVVNAHSGTVERLDNAVVVQLPTGFPK